MSVINRMSQRQWLYRHPHHRPPANKPEPIPVPTRQQQPLAPIIAGKRGRSRT